jgi:acetyl-CoA carboxylase carboxyltransferase component
VSWEAELEELRRREELARAMGGEERVARQHASGRLTVRERIERLFDPGSFHETARSRAAPRTTSAAGSRASFRPTR